MRSRVRPAHDPLRAEWAILAALAASALAAPALAAPPATSPACIQDGAQPPPGQSECVARKGGDDENVALLLPRAALAIPRLLFRTATELLTFGTEIHDQYDFADRMSVIEATPKFRIFPSVRYDSGNGPAFGAGIARDDAFGAGETLSARGIYGASFRQLYEGEASSGQRFGAITPAIRFGYERDNRPRFYGIGNGDRVNPARLDLPLDAQLPGPAVRTYYRVEQLRLRYLIGSQLSPTWQANVSQLWRARQLSSGPDNGPRIDAIFAPETLVGFGPLLVDAYTEIELVWDSREALRDDTPRALPGAGFRMQTWSGLQKEFAAPNGAFARLGIDLHSFIDLYRGNRILHLRARAALALGSPENIPFLDLPQLGGSLLLRGYDTGRFRGPLSLLGSAEYRWPIQERIAAYMFIDTGRVFTGVNEIHARGFADSRVGFGIGLQAFTISKALFRIQLASSIDGSVFFHLAINTTDEFSATY